MQGGNQLGYHLVNHVSEFKTKPMLLQSVKFYSLSYFRVKTAKHLDTQTNIWISETDPFVPLLLSRLWTVQTTCAVSVELLKVLPNIFA